MDNISNAFAKMKNAISRKKPTVNVVKSNVMESILGLLKKEGFIEDFQNSTESKFQFSVKLKYYKGKSVIQGIEKVSKLSRRVYCSVDNLPRIFNNLGVAIVSTSKGVLTDKEARALGVGGEVIGKVW